MANRRFGTVRRLPSGRYQARYSDASGRRFSAPLTFARKADANAWLASIQTDLRRGDMIDPALGRISFGEWASEWQRTAVALRPSTGPPTSERRFFRGSNPSVQRAGLTPLRIHDLRHTAVAMWIAPGLSPIGIAKRAGHTSVVTVQDRYGHLLAGGEEAADAALEAMARTARAHPIGRVGGLNPT